MFSNGAITLPRDFRFHHEEELPRTPEPMMGMAEEPRQPSPPRPARLRVKRRNGPSLQGPTQQFLASVAAADLPLPTTELPAVNHHSLPARSPTMNLWALPVTDTSEDSEMPDIKEPFASSGFLFPPHHSSSKMNCLPRTPEPESALEQESSRPDWSMGARISTDNTLQRPTSSMSTASDCSEASFYSGSRRSHQSEDGSCTSPDSDLEDPFQFPSIPKGKARDIPLSIHLDAPVEFAPLNQKLRSKKRKDAPWSKAMSKHVWDTYVLYLQDPTVTPFRANGVPPEGVCHRVAREAKRSWKGPRSTTELRRSDRLSMANASNCSEKSGSLTPTAEAPKLYVQWPHSSGATRNHLRELCRKESTAAQRHRHFQTRSSTPFTKARSHGFSNPRTPPPRSTFNTKDIVLSLATSTSVTMQPDGPLASLAMEDSDITPTPDIELSVASPPQLRPFEPIEPQALVANIEELTRNRRLGSPFVARTYGPSSAQLLHHRRSSPPRNPSENGLPRLRSPLQFNHVRSLNSTQKRRAPYALDEDRAALRPSVFEHQLFGTPIGSRRVRSRGFSLGNEAFGHRTPGLVQRPPPNFDLAGKFGPHTESNTLHPKSGPSLLPAPGMEPPSLGSPFSTGPSQTFPRRLFPDSQATIKRGVFATMHQSRHSIESFDFGPSPQQTRLELLDSKLKEIQEREAAAKR